jgi:hypothetical protein
MFGRRGVVPPGFERVAAAVERAKAAALSAVPAPRREPEPLAPAVVALEGALADAREALATWTESPPEVRERCRAALEETARRAEWLRLEAPSMDFESLVLVLGDVIAPLDAFVDAEHELRRRG